MIAVDTNIIVRLIVGDDAGQVERALALASRETFYVSFTVMIETGWVLRSRYGYDRAGVVRALLTLPELVDLTFERDDDARWAIARYAERGELADYVHIAAARPIGRIASFETRLPHRAGPNAPATVEIPA